MTAHPPDLVARVRAAGGRLTLDNGDLYVETANPLPDELIEQLRAAKSALTDLLAEPDGAWFGSNAVLLAVPDGVPEAWTQA